MSLPILRQTGRSDVQLSRAYTYPINKSGKAHQVQARRGDGTPQTAKIATGERHWNLLFRQLSQTDYDNVLAFFEDPLVDYMMHQWTFVDIDDVSHAVHYLQATVDMVEVSQGNFDWRLELRLDLP